MDQDKYDEYLALVEAYYKEFDPTADVSKGSVVHELVIRPAAYLFARNAEDLEGLMTQYSLPLLAENPNPDEQMAENLAANFRITRRAGIPGSGYVAIYSDSTDDLYVSAGTVMHAGGVELVVPVSYIGVEELDDRENTDTLKYREFSRMSDSEWAFTIEVVTADNTDVIIPAGTPVVFEAPNPRISRSEISSAVAGGSGEESITHLVERVATGVTAKIPSGRAHIKALLEYSGLHAIDVVVKGMGDPEMLRDRNNPLGISVGGRVDVWCRFREAPVTMQAPITATKGPDGLWRAFIDKGVAPGWYDITTISHPDNPGVITNSSEIDVFFGASSEIGGPEVFDGMSARYSQYQTANIAFEYPGVQGPTELFQASFRVQPEITEAQELLNSADIDNPQQDNLVKGVVPADVGITVGFVNSGPDVETDEVAATLASYINSLPIGRGFLSASELAVAVSSVYPDLTMLLPVVLRASAPMPAGDDWSMETSEGVLELPEDTLDGVSGKVMAMVCAPGDVGVSLLRD